MVSPRPRSPYVVEAAQLLGAQIRLARRERRWSKEELAERIGITEKTLTKVERGDLSVGLGTALEAAALVGVPLFHEDRAQIRSDVARARDRTALLPQRVRTRKADVHDDF